MAFSVARYHKDVVVFLKALDVKTGDCIIAHTLVCESFNFVLLLVEEADRAIAAAYGD